MKIVERLTGGSLMRLLVLAVAVLGLPYAQVRGQSTPQPIVVKGFEDLAAGRCRDAMNAWTATWVGAEAVKKAQIVNSCDVLEPMGKVNGYDILRTVDVTPHLQRVYAVLLYDSQPVYFLIVAYAPGRDWKIDTVSWNTNPDKVIPSEYLPAQHPGQ